MHTTRVALIVATTIMFVATLTARQDTRREAATVRQVMETMTIPASETIFSAAVETPKDDTVWQEVRQSAVVLAESGDLLMTGDRVKDGAAWMELSRALVTQAQATLKAIDSKDPDALAQAGDDLYVTCKACHDRYIAK